MVGGFVKSAAAFSSQQTGGAYVAARNTSLSGVNGCGRENIAHPEENGTAVREFKKPKKERFEDSRRANRRRFLGNVWISGSRTTPRSRLEPKRAETTTLCAGVKLPSSSPIGPEPPCGRSLCAVHA